MCVSPVRAATGAAILAAPKTLSKAFDISATTPEATAYVRALGARDVLLGTLASAIFMRPVDSSGLDYVGLQIVIGYLGLIAVADTIVLVARPAQPPRPRSSSNSSARRVCSGYGG